jgi:energy-coupling factor transport system substrate-specific component
MAKVSSIYLSNQFVLFLCSSGAALVLHWVARMLLSLVLPFSVAVVLAYGVGMVSAYLLQKRYVFTRSANSRSREIGLFLAVNLAWLPVVWVLSLWLGDNVLAHLMDPGAAHAIGHGVAITTPVLVNFAFHKFLTFRERPAGGADA